LTDGDELVENLLQSIADDMAANGLMAFMEYQHPFLAAYCYLVGFDQDMPMS
jgi:hypothetical protein